MRSEIACACNKLPALAPLLDESAGQAVGQQATRITRLRTGGRKMPSENRVLKIVLAILLPPAAVAVHSGISGQFWLNLILTILGFWIVGIIHALIVVL